MNIWTYIMMGAIAVVFAILWKQGTLLQLSNYVAGTREELKKCNWSTWAELKGSTLVILISILLLGGFTVMVDLVFNFIVHHIA